MTFKDLFFRLLQHREKQRQADLADLAARQQRLDEEFEIERLEHQFRLPSNGRRLDR